MTNDPMSEWVLKDEILAAMHRWPLIVIFALAGAIIGLAAAHFWPMPYRANVDISVELNPYRILDDQYLPAFTNAEFRNIDDYKHWQMLQLSIIVLSDPYMVETLNQLREIDPYWDSVDEQELRNRLSADWRNAGLWSLSANGETKSHTVDAVEVWRDVILDFTNDTIASSKSLFQLELSLRSLNDQLIENQLQLSLLMDSLRKLENTHSELSGLSQDSVLSNEIHQEIFQLNTQLVEGMPGEVLGLGSIPDQNSTVAEYRDWIEKMTSPVEDQIIFLQLKGEILGQEISDATLLWESALQDGKGLSATLNLVTRASSAPEVRQIRSYGFAALAGSMVGLLIWIGFLLFQIICKGSR